MPIQLSDLRRIDGVCEIERFRAPGADPSRPPDLLIEVPHGATLPAHFEALRARLRGSLPDRIEHLFYVGTDVGAPECARAVAESVPHTVVVRSLIPRTFIDCNRTLETAPAGAGSSSGAQMTAGIPDFVRDPDDVALLRSLHADYQRVTERIYADVIGNGGRALMLHSYAPKSVEVDPRLTGDVVSELHAAYVPETYARWPERAPADLITATPDGKVLASLDLVRKVKAELASVGIEAAENHTYQLHPATTGAVYAARYPGRTLCLELRRDLLMRRFTPFEPMEADPAAIAKIAGALARAHLS